MIKKALYIIFAVYFLSLAVGVSINEHRCGDELISVSIDALDDCACDMQCGMCELDNRYIHLQADFIIEHSGFEILPQLFHLPAVFHKPEITSLDTDLHTGLINPDLHIKTPERLARIQSFRC